MGSGGLRGLQILRSDVQSVRGGFDSHTFPPFSLVAGTSPARAGPLIRAATLAAGTLALAALLLCAGAPRSARAQVPPVPPPQDSLAAPAPAEPDSSAILEIGGAIPRPPKMTHADSVSAAEAAAPPRWSDEPRWVMMRSLLIPGWGQFHNRSYTKAVVIAGIEGWLIVNIVQDKHDLNGLEQAVHDAEAGGDPVEAQNAVDAYNEALNRYQGRTWLLAGVIVYSMIDAYVDAHFRNFGVEFKLDSGPGAAMPGTQRLALRWTF